MTKTEKLNRKLKNQKVQERMWNWYIKVETLFNAEIHERCVIAEVWEYMCERWDVWCNKASILEGENTKRENKVTSGLQTVQKRK